MKLNYNFLHLASIQLVKVHQRFILLRDSEIKIFCILNGSNRAVLKSVSCYGLVSSEGKVVMVSYGTKVRCLRPAVVRSHYRRPKVPRGLDGEGKVTRAGA